MVRAISGAISMAFLLFIAVQADHACAAEVYKWKDKDGRVHFSDKPPQQGGSDRINVNPIPRGESAAEELTPASPTPSPASLPGRKQPLDIVMYSTQRCKYCRQAREFFTARGISWREVDTEGSDAEKNEFKSRGGGGVPLFYINGQRLQGFSESSMQKALAAFGH